jgi:uncharacterized metal-binding protein
VSNSASCACSGAPTLIFACSGASDVGEIADHAARRLRDQGAGKMYCLAGIGGRVSGIVKTTEAAGKVLAIDGCPLDCAKNSLVQAGFQRFEHVRLADLGLAKGSSPVTEDRVTKVVAAGVAALSNASGQAQSGCRCD